MNLVLERLQRGDISDFRMIIKGGNQRVTNGNTTMLKGRAKELQEKGFYFLFYNPKGSMLSDVWQILPEDTHGRTTHFAPFPEDLVKTPILLTCHRSLILSQEPVQPTLLPHCLEENPSVLIEQLNT